jgi:hypothetical protein
MGRGQGQQQNLEGWRRGKRPWDKKRLEAELAVFLRGRSYFPTASELEREGHHGLRYALRRLGGHVYWAKRMGLPLRPGQDRRPYGTDEARRDIAAVKERYGTVPAEQRLRDLGYPRLASFVKARGGVRAFCRQQGIDLPPRRRGLFD